MKWHTKVWFSDKAQKKRDQLIAALADGKPFPQAYLVTFPTEGDGQLEIFPAWMLQHRDGLDQKAVAVGAALGYMDAKELVCRIVEDVLMETGRADHLEEDIRRLG